MAKAKPKSTHEFTGAALTSLLKLVDGCDPGNQPSGDLLASFEKLLDLHHSGSPASNVDERLAEIVRRLDKVEKQVSVSQLGRR